MRIIRKVFLMKEIFFIKGENNEMKLKVINFHSDRVYLYLKRDYLRKEVSESFC